MAHFLAQSKWRTHLRDGYTIGSFVIAVPLIGHVIGIPELAPEKFDPLGIFLTYPFVLAASKDAPVQNASRNGGTRENKRTRAWPLWCATGANKGVLIPAAQLIDLYPFTVSD